MRKKDITNMRKAEQMKEIFGGLTSGYSPANREPTQEGLSDDEDF